MFKLKNLCLFIAYWLVFITTLLILLFSSIDISYLQQGAFSVEPIHLMNEENILIYSIFVCFLYQLVISRYARKTALYHHKTKIYYLSYSLDLSFLWILAAYSTLANYAAYYQAVWTHKQFTLQFILYNPFFWACLIVYLCITLLIQLKYDNTH